MRRTRKESRYPGLPWPPTCALIPACGALSAAGPPHTCLGGWGAVRPEPPSLGAAGLGRPVADGCPCPVCPLKLLDSDQELYRNFPLTISERWQQEVAETVFDTINAETDRLEARKKTKNKQLGHEEGEGSRLPWAPTGRFRDKESARVLGSRPGSQPEWPNQVPALGRWGGRGWGAWLSAPLALSRQTTPWARTVSCTATCPRWATPS